MTPRSALSRLSSLSSLSSLFIFIALFSPADSSFAAKSIKKFSGPDFSGSYSCEGNDASEGPYTGKVHLKLNNKHSQAEFGAYEFLLEVPGYGSYPGHAAANGKQVAMHFANTDPNTKDYGTGIASFSKNKKGKWTFHKYYYEPEFKGGNFGFERCTQD